MANRQREIDFMKHCTHEEKIIECWQRNASPWIGAIQHDEIASRLLVTNQAIVDAVLLHKPETVLDIGCGEGWLTDTLAQQGVDAYGVDATPALIEFARQNRQGRFAVMAYEQLSQIPDKFAAVVCNFSLLGKESAEQVFTQAGKLLTADGRFIVQTLHPVHCAGELPYVDGWRDGSWAGFSPAFTEPAPWYFRTIPSWEVLFASNGFLAPRIIEPIHPQTGLPASIIFIAELNR